MDDYGLETLKYTGLTMEDFILKIDADPVYGIRLCHGFWEQYVRFLHVSKIKNIDPFDDREKFCAIIRSFSPNWPDHFFYEILDVIEKPSPNAMRFLSPFGWKNGLNVEGTPREGLHETEKLIGDSVKGNHIYDGLFWKNSISDKTIDIFIDYIKDKNVLLVTPDYANNISNFLGFEADRHFNVDSHKAAWSLDKTCNEVGDYIVSTGKKFIVLVEMGGVTSSLFCYRMFQLFPDSSFIPMGQALNLACFERIEVTNWYRSHRNSINDYLIERHNKSNTVLSDEQKYLMEGVDYNLIDNIDFCVYKNANNFVENKKVKKPLIDKLLSMSTRKNQWANMGPVVSSLEESVKKLLNLPKSQSLVAVKSGTSAVSLLVGLEEVKRGKKLKWVAPNFGFFTNALGPLHDAILIDCNKTGLIDINILMSLDDSVWDALLITNTFGINNFGVNKIIDYCQNVGKAVVVDNAVNFLSIPEINSKISQAISLHHTKSWGFGEGGLIVVDRKDEEIVRRLANFDYFGNEIARRHATNAKMSDVCSSYILQRILTHPSWVSLYRMQMRRIIKIANDAGLVLLGQLNSQDVYTFLPFVSKKIISKSSLENKVITLRKYYKPLDNSQPMSQEIFSKIVCIPCHPDISNISDNLIYTILSTINSEE